MSKKGGDHMKKLISILLAFTLILLCGCYEEDKNDFGLSSYYEDVYLDNNQNNTSNKYSYGSSGNKGNANTNKSLKTSKQSDTASKVDTTIRFVKTSEFANIGKTLSQISKANPKMVANPSKATISGKMAQLFGEANGKFAYYFYSSYSLPYLSNLLNDTYSPYINCVGLYTTVGRVFKNTSSQTTVKQFFKDLNIKDYTYTSNLENEPGFVKFSYQNYDIIISYFSEIDKNLIGNSANLQDLPPQYIKDTYPVFIIDRTVNSGLGYDKWVSDNN